MARYLDVPGSRKWMDQWWSDQWVILQINPPCISRLELTRLLTIYQLPGTSQLIPHSLSRWVITHWSDHHWSIHFLSGTSKLPPHRPFQFLSPWPVVEPTCQSSWPSVALSPWPSTGRPTRPGNLWRDPKQTHVNQVNHTRRAPKNQVCSNEVFLTPPWQPLGPLLKVKLLVGPTCKIPLNQLKGANFGNKAITGSMCQAKWPKISCVLLGYWDVLLVLSKWIISPLYK